MSALPMKKIFLAAISTLAFASAVHAGEVVTATSGATSIKFEVTDEPVTYYDAWYAIGGFEAKTYSLQQGHIGYRDLTHGIIPQAYQLPRPNTPWRYFKRQTISSEWTADPGTDPVSLNSRTTTDGRLNAQIDVDEFGKVTITTASASSTSTTVYRGSDSNFYTAVDKWNDVGGFFYKFGTLHWNEQETFSSTETGGSNSIQLVGAAAAFYEAQWTYPAYWDAAQVSEPHRPYDGSPFAKQPIAWTETGAVWHNTAPDGWGGTYGFGASLQLSNEDLISGVQSRIDRDRAALAFDLIPWGSRWRDRYGALTKGSEYTDSVWLYNYKRDFTEFGDFTEENAQVRFNVPSQLRIPGIGFRGRVMEAFYPADGSPMRIVKIHDVTMYDGHWESDIITPELSADGSTVLQFFSVVTEAIQPRKILVLPPPGGTPPLTAPAEYAKTKPTISREAQAIDTGGSGTIYRYMLKDSLTLQQINLGDAWGAFSDWSQAKATWAVLPNPTATVRLWHWKDDGSVLGVWNLLSEGDDLTAYYGSRKDYIFAEVLKPGQATLRFTITANDQQTYDDIVVEGTLAKVTLAVDANRDGIIELPPDDPNATYNDATSTGSPYRFWVNDDSDSSGVDVADIPGSASPDGQQPYVQGIRDLIDFFPVCLDLKQVLQVFPPSTSVKYKLKQADEGLRFVYTDLSRGGAFKYLRDFDTANNLKGADAHRITSDGWELDAAWLNQMLAGSEGIILVEGRNATTQPLVLSVEKNGNVVAEAKLYLAISAVEAMFRRLNLRDLDPAATGLVGVKGDSAPASSMGDPEGFPDAQNSSTDHWLIFLHGYNVGGEAARGWNAEMFKRLYWSGNKARFVGVSWFGNPDDPSGPAPADYHLAVRNALATAPRLASSLAGLSGSKAIVSHSLGCAVVASAIADYGMAVSEACFVDAALARECVDGASATDATGMTPSVWRDYDPRFYAANWCNLFPGDARSQLTWRGRFAAVNSSIYNFYSSTEDVLAEQPDDVPEGVFSLAFKSDFNFAAYTWVYQEKAKGARVNYANLSQLHVGSYYMGWGFNLKDPVSFNDPIYWKWTYSDPNYPENGQRAPELPGEIDSVSTPVLKRDPVFDPGWGQVLVQNFRENPVSNTLPVQGAPDWIFNLYLENGGNYVDEANHHNNRAWLMAEGVPALSWALGSHSSNQITSSRQFDLPIQFADTAHWPRPKPNGIPEWQHSDVHNLEYVYQVKLFDKLVNICNQ